MRAILLISLLLIFVPHWHRTDIRWYQGPGLLTASGQMFNPEGLTYASKTHEFGTKLDIKWKTCIITATCNDRGPNEVELTRGAFSKLEKLSVGVLRNAEYKIHNDD